MHTGSRSARCLAAVIALVGLGLSPGLAAEILDYRVTYDGVFSAFKAVPIGDARLDVEQTTASLDGAPVMRARLTASSAAYPLVEQLYPYRYEFTSYHQSAIPRTLAYERRKQTTRLRHDLLLVDWGDGALRRFNIDQEATGRKETARETRALLSTLRRAGMADHGPRLAPQDGELSGLPHSTLDRLALLQRVRGLPMVEGARHEFTATDGKTLIRYAATVLGRERLELPMGGRPAWKLRIDGFEATEEGPRVEAQESLEVLSDASDGTEELRHPPVFIWLDSGPRRLPLRLESRQAVGTFTVALQRELTVQSAALATPEGGLGAR